MVGRLHFLLGASLLLFSTSLKVIPFMVIIFGLNGLLTLRSELVTSVLQRVIF